MNFTYHCPQCQTAVRSELSADSAQIMCPHCGLAIDIPAGALADGQVSRCLVCPSVDLFVRKDFPQRLGVTLVVLGFVGSSIAWAYYQVIWTFAILFFTALVDFVLYVVMGESLTCYRCGAQYRGAEQMEAHGPFNLETHERYRQMAARLSDGQEQGVVGRE